MDKPKVAVVILNYNTLHFLKLFLGSVCQTAYENVDVIVADNASTDGSAEWVQQNFSTVQLIQLDRNYGFTGGYNRALSMVNADYYVLLNSDVQVTEDWLRPMVNMSMADNRIAAIQPHLLKHSQSDMFEYAGAAGGFIDKFGFPFCRGRIFESVETNSEQYNQAIPIFWSSGAAMFIRSDCWKLVGGLDEDFFAHMEEIDICWRLQDAGYTVMSCPQSRVYHVGGGTLSKENPRKTYYNFRNGLILLIKNLPGNKLLTVLFIRLILDHIAAYRWLFAGHFGDYSAVAKAHFHFFIRFRKWYGKRNNSKKTAYFNKQVFRKSIVWQFFVLKTQVFTHLQDKSGFNHSINNGEK